jgi:hypothetical protein
MSAKSTYLKNKIVNHVLRNTTYTAPATVYLALYTDDPTDDNTGTEVTGGSYARQAVAFDASAAGLTANTSLITFPTASAAWGEVTNWGLCDANAAGNLLYHAALDNPQVVANGNVFTVAAGALDVSEQ